ncbi:MAG: nitronate monooxygenase [Alicyclobacillaceae bacterium]|nr:nitronate monooxygenase [Alicyclobacillaceae bacterium]
MKTRVTELLGCRWPIIQGGLHRLAKAEFATAVSRTGAFGLITAGCYETVDEFRAAVEWARQNCPSPFGVNITLGVRKPMDEYVEAAAEFPGIPIFTSGMNPERLVPVIKRSGNVWVHAVTSVRHALKAERLGADAVVAVGFEAAGHPGLDDVGGLALIPRVVDAVRIPVIAAGGIADGRGVVAALSLGAEGVQMGTRFLATEECGLPPALRDCLISATECDTIMIKRSIGKPNRVLKTPAASRVREMEDRGAAFEEWFPLISGEAYDRLLRTGDRDAGVLSLGQSVGLVDRIDSVANVVETIVRQMEETLCRLESRLRQEIREG